MIQKAIVEAIENDYQVKVRIPKYDKMSYDGTNYHELSTGIICSTPGSLVNYSVGDIVLVGFENDEISKPVILGLLYTNNNAESSVNFPEITDKLDTVSASLDKLTKANVFIHIKYSNDNGVTFTSLYDYADKIKSGVDSYSANEIEIDVKSSYVAWNIVDNSNISKLSDFDITTTITATFANGNKNSISSKDSVVEVPDEFNYSDSLTVSYTLQVLEGSIDDYNISLFTDRNPIGSTEGDYIGFYYSNSEVASTNPIDYSWGAIKPRVQKFIDEAYNDLLRRIQTNERYLYGKAEEDSKNTNTGISSAIVVKTNVLELNQKSEILLANNIYKQGNFIKMDTTGLSLYFNNIRLVANSNGHFQIKLGDK